jgi:hypothetical protein
VGGTAGEDIDGANENVVLSLARAAFIAPQGKPQGPTYSKSRGLSH